MQLDQCCSERQQLYLLCPLRASLSHNTPRFEQTCPETTSVPCTKYITYYRSSSCRSLGATEAMLGALVAQPVNSGSRLNARIVFENF